MSQNLVEIRIPRQSTGLTIFPPNQNRGLSSSQKHSRFPCGWSLSGQDGSTRPKPQLHEP